MQVYTFLSFSYAGQPGEMGFMNRDVSILNYIKFQLVLGPHAPYN